VAVEIARGCAHRRLRDVDDESVLERCRVDRPRIEAVFGRELAVAQCDRLAVDPPSRLLVDWLKDRPSVVNWGSRNSAQTVSANARRSRSSVP